MVIVLYGTVGASSEPFDVPPGRDPGGTAVAILSSPFSLSSNQLLHRLARDGEGLAIGWDFSRRQAETQAAHVSSAPELANALARSHDIRIVAAFVDQSDPTTWAKAVAFIAKTPARIVAVPFTTTDAQDWTIFRASAERFPDVLFVVSADSQAGRDALSPAYPAAFNLSNVLSVTTQGAPGADIAVALAPEPAALSASQRTGAAIATTIKTLITCVLVEQSLAGPNAKLWALMGLASLSPLQLPGDATPGALLLRPCAEAEIGSHRSD